MDTPNEAEQEEQQDTGIKKSKFALKEKETKVSEENALEQLMLLVERYNIDVEAKRKEAAEEGKPGKPIIEKMLESVLSAIMRGALEVYEENGFVKVKQFLQHTSEKSTVSELVYNELTGKDHEAMKEKEGDSPFKKAFDLLGSLCTSPAGRQIVGKLRASDLTDAEALSTLFSHM